MKRKSLLTLSLICLISLSLTRSHDGTVKWVNDGDTILLTTGESVRYVGIDAPEMGHKGGKTMTWPVLQRRSIGTWLLKGG